MLSKGWIGSLPHWNKPLQSPEVRHLFRASFSTSIGHIFGPCCHQVRVALALPMLNHIRSYSFGLFITAAVLVPLLICFGSILSGARILAYRDVSSFYYPLYAWIDTCWLSGELPLWNPQQGIGTPVVAEATSAVFYPGKLIFALPLDYTLRFNLYIVFHFLLAAAATYMLARSWNTSRPAAALASVSYTMGGAVLFQSCNVVFLVGAAWLPLALLAAVRMLVQRSIVWAMVFGAILACMVLGGDPQAAYHSGLLATLGAWLFWMSHRRASRSVQGPLPNVLAWYRQHTTLLAAAAATGALLAAVQIAPAVRWVRTSHRASFSSPRTLYELPSVIARTDVNIQQQSHQAMRSTGQSELALAQQSLKPDSEFPTSEVRGTSELQGAPAAPGRSIAKGLFGQPETGTHHRQLYQFSLPPWRLLETVLPNISGRMFPRNQRWLTAIGAEGRIWTPSLYLGLLPLLLAASQWKLRTEDRRIQWLSWIILLATLGSFGWYGLGWLVREAWLVTAAEPATDAIGSPTGGLYWLMVVLLPGYVDFRYPAKLFTCTALGISILSAIGLDRLLSANRAGFRRALWAIGAVSLLVGLATLASRIWWQAMLAGARSDELFGPLDIVGSRWGVFWACMHTVATSAIALWILGSTQRRFRTTACLLLLLTSIELTWANHWMILTAPTSAITTASILSTSADSASENGRVQQSQSQPPTRFYRSASRRWVPAEWYQSSSARRAERTVAWDRATLFPNLHLLGSRGALRAQTTITSRNYRALMLAGESNAPTRQTLNLLGATNLLLPARGKRSVATVHVETRGAALPNVELRHNPTAYPRTWIVHDVQWQRWRDTNNPVQLDREIDNLLFVNGKARDFLTTAIVETDAPAGLRHTNERPNGFVAENCRIAHCSRNQLEITASLNYSGLLVVSDQYDSAWVCDMSSSGEPPRRVPIVRTNRVMQGVFLPPGEHYLVFRYRPIGLGVAATLSSVAWLAFLAVMVLRRQGRTPGVKRPY